MVSQHATRGSKKPPNRPLPARICTKRTISRFLTPRNLRYKKISALEAVQQTFKLATSHSPRFAATIPPCQRLSYHSHPRIQPLFAPPCRRALASANHIKDPSTERHTRRSWATTSPSSSQGASPIPFPRMDKKSKLI